MTTVFSASASSRRRLWLNPSGLATAGFCRLLLNGLLSGEYYITSYGNLREAEIGLGGYFKFYNEVRPHQSLSYKTPQAWYQGLRQH